jgi:transcriptional regulator with XRE-family HTH domain
MSDMQTPAAKLGHRIRMNRRRQGRWVDQGHLAFKIGMSQSNLSRIESGAVAVTLDALCAIAAALGTTASELLREAGL